VTYVGVIRQKFGDFGQASELPPFARLQV
jgi:hypothetical protein